MERFSLRYIMYTMTTESLGLWKSYTVCACSPDHCAWHEDGSGWLPHLAAG